MISEAAVISANLKSQPTWIVNDVKTFQWLRLNKQDLITKNNLGGGNILSIVGLFSVLNLYAKLHKILQSGMLPRKDCEEDNKKTFVEDRAFKSLVRDFGEQIVDPEQNNKTLTTIWRTFRNALSHVAQIYPGNQAFVVINDTSISGEEIRPFLRSSSDKIFTQFNNDGFVCFVDKLIDYLERVRDWIISNMENHYKEENIKIAHNWIIENTHAIQKGQN